MRRQPNRYQTFSRIALCAATLVAASAIRSRAAERFDQLRGWYDDDTGDALPIVSWRGSDGDFAAELFITDNAPSFVAAWSAASQSNGPDLPEIQTVAPGHDLTAYIIYAGCGILVPTCNATADFKLVRPDHKVYAAINKFPLASKGPHRPKLLYLARGGFTFQFDPKDRQGLYKLYATVRDPDTGKSLALHRIIELRP